VRNVSFGPQDTFRTYLKTHFTQLVLIWRVFLPAVSFFCNRLCGSPQLYFTGLLYCFRSHFFFWFLPHKIIRSYSCQKLKIIHTLILLIRRFIYNFFKINKSLIINYYCIVDFYILLIDEKFNLYILKVVIF